MLQTFIYNMSSYPRGRAVILNNINFTDEAVKMRGGSDIDAARLSRLFRQLGFEVIHWNDVTPEVSEKY